MSRQYTMLVFIILITAGAIWVDLPNNPGIHILGIDREIETSLGLDLVGGVQALLEVDLPDTVEIDAQSMVTAREIIEKRVNGLLGVGEGTVQRAGERRIVVELPGETDPEKALATIGETGQLEFVDFSVLPPTQAYGMIGSTIVTNYQPASESVVDAPVFNTIMTGERVQEVSVGRGILGEYEVYFSLDNEGSQVFEEHTRNNRGNVLAIVLDKVVISAPEINDVILGGQGSISGNFTSESANDLAIQLRYGSLPIPLRIAESSTVGPSLGQDSLEKSLVAGLIGFGIVVLYMGLYYRLPGLLANIALLIYAAITFALFKLFSVTLTLPGIAGFVLSVGVAVDANVLIFERLKEELRAGKNLNTAIQIGWERAWSSIRDSNVSTLITCAILFWFGANFGASIVQGFAVTLAIGVLVSLFTAITATRTFLLLVTELIDVKNYSRWFSI